MVGGGGGVDGGIGVGGGMENDSTIMGTTIGYTPNASSTMAHHRQPLRSLQSNNGGRVGLGDGVGIRPDLLGKALSGLSMPKEAMDATGAGAHLKSNYF